MLDSLGNYITSTSRMRKIITHLILWVLFYLFLLFWYWGSAKFLYVDLFHLDNYKIDFGNRDNMMFCLILCLTTMLNYYLLVYIAIAKLSNRDSIIKGIVSTVVIIIVGYVLCYLCLYYFFEKFNHSQLYKYFSQRQFDTQILNFKNLLFYLNITIYFIAFAITTKLGKDYYLSEKETRKLNKLRNQAEVDYLKNQIRPHFLFNALNSIYGLSLNNSEANKQILSLSEILRYYVYSPKNIISFNEFTTILEKIIPQYFIANNHLYINAQIEKAKTFSILSYFLKNIDHQTSVEITITENLMHIRYLDLKNWEISLINPSK